MKNKNTSQNGVFSEKEKALLYPSFHCVVLFFFPRRADASETHTALFLPLHLRLQRSEKLPKGNLIFFLPLHKYHYKY